MVKFRGIEVSIVSQLDCRRLPELDQAFSADSLGTGVACYVPINQGSQIWFEYSVDGPHPPGAAYFFKLSINGRTITSWDCTAKHDYYGKTAYSLQPLQPDEFGMPAVVQQAFHFAIKDGGPLCWNDDYIEIRVHRIEHRRRIRKPHGTTGSTIPSLSVVQLVDVGLLEPGRPARYYQYQLVDPQDEPYASFRFYCRTYDYLARHKFISIILEEPTSSVSASSSEYFDSPEIQPAKNLRRLETFHSSPPSSPFKNQSSPRRNKFVAPYTSTNASEESLNTLTIDSIEDLPSGVSRSPQSKKSSNMNLQEREIPLSPTRAPRHTHSKAVQNLTGDVGKAASDLKTRRRPPSPSMNGELLQQFVSNAPLSVPAKITEFKPTIEAEIQEQLEREKLAVPEEHAVQNSATRAQRGGRALKIFLGRRAGRRTPT